MRLLYIFYQTTKTLDWSKYKSSAEEKIKYSTNDNDGIFGSESIKKHECEMGKMLLTSIFFFSHDVFKSFCLTGVLITDY